MVSLQDTHHLHPRHRASAPTSQIRHTNHHCRRRCRLVVAKICLCMYAKQIVRSVRRVGVLFVTFNTSLTPVCVCVCTASNQFSNATKQLLESRVTSLSSDPSASDPDLMAFAIYMQPKSHFGHGWDTLSIVVGHCLHTKPGWVERPGHYSSRHASEPQFPPKTAQIFASARYRSIE